VNTADCDTGLFKYFKTATCKEALEQTKYYSDKAKELYKEQELQEIQAAERAAHK
jgi:hypothetical protein